MVDDFPPLTYSITLKGGIRASAFLVVCEAAVAVVFFCSVFDGVWAVSAVAGGISRINLPGGKVTHG